MKNSSQYPIKKYDKRHDVLHIFLDSQYDSYFDEEMPGIYVARNDNTQKIVGFTVMDYQQNKDIFQRCYPAYATF